MTDPDPKTPEQLLRQALDQRSRDLDADTLSRLNRARQRALDRKSRRSHGGLPAWLPAGAAAAATIAGLGLALWLNPDLQTGMALEDINGDLEIIASGDELELIEEMEFYDWLEQQDALPADADPA